MVETRWQVRFTLDELPVPVVPLPFVEQASSGWDEWRAVSDVPVGTPFLVSPDFRYDVVLNSYFTSALMVGAAPKTREAHARDVAAFLSFLGSARSGRGWRDADESDHLAYLHWRRRDPAGPRVAGSTWASRGRHGELVLPVGRPVWPCRVEPDPAAHPPDRSPRTRLVRAAGS